MKTLLKILVPILLLLAAYLGAKQMIASKPELQSKQPPAVIPKVSTLQVSPATHSPPISSFGNVQSYFETTLTPQVAGAISSVSPQFRLGLQVKKGDILATIDSTDYQATVARESANLANNQRLLEEESIRAAQAEEDWTASGRPLASASDFVLRKPQLAAARANVASSKASLKKAQTDIERCNIIAPFDAIITARNASPGNYATPQSQLGNLVSTDLAEVRLPITPEQSARIQLPHATGTPLQILLSSATQADHTWAASVKRVEPVIDPQNQVTYLIAEIDSPYNSTAPLSVGSFVNALIPTIPLTDTLEIPEEALINDNYIWLVDNADQLVKSHAERLYSYKNKAYVRLLGSEIEPPFTIISRPLTNFRSGMKVEALPN